MKSLNTLMNFDWVHRRRRRRLDLDLRLWLFGFLADLPPLLLGLGEPSELFGPGASLNILSYCVMDMFETLNGKRQTLSGLS